MFGSTSTGLVRTVKRAKLSWFLIGILRAILRWFEQ